MLNKGKERQDKLFNTQYIFTVQRKEPKLSMRWIFRLSHVTIHKTIWQTCSIYPRETIIYNFSFFFY